MRIRIDWLYLRNSFILFGVCLVISIALIFIGFELEQKGKNEYETAVSSLRQSHNLYKTIIKDIELLDQYTIQFNDFKSSGMIGKERRLSWVESLKAANASLKLPQLNYRLESQEEFARPGLKFNKKVPVKSSPMILEMGLLHEGDLFELLGGLRKEVQTLFTVDSCELTRVGDFNSSLDTKQVNMNAQCTIRWVTIDDA